MNCAACRATFAALGDDPSKSRALRLDEEQPNCTCQSISVSPFSRGPVEADEILIRLLVAPQHAHRKGGAKAAALTDAERNGLSLFREADVTDAQLCEVAESLVARARARGNSKAGVFGVLRIACKTIRNCQIELETAPCYCVYDTGMCELPSHAEAFQRVAATAAELVDARRNQLFSLIRQTFVPVQDFRNRLLVHLAPPL